jgi:hypothetical protein
MKTLALKLSILILITGLSFNAFSQTINIDSTFYSDTEIYPFSQVDSIYSLNMSGYITLNSDTSLIRIILTDTFGNEFMIYEAYPLITTSMNFEISEVCDETCYLNGITPYSLIIHLNDASITLQSIIYSTSFVDNADSLRYQEKLIGDSIKVQIMNNNIVSLGMKWIACVNEITKLSYSEKKELFGNRYSFNGFDYYAGGLYDFTFGNLYEPTFLEIVPEFDWRKRHNANIDLIPNSPYYDEFLGWMTPVGTQLCSHCWIFAPVHATEALVNLYFNQQLNLDLSEQSVASCKTPWDDCSGGDIDNTFEYIIDSGIIDENCFQYIISGPAGNINPCIPCPDPEEKISIDYANNFVLSEEAIKTTIITKGPVVMNVKNWGHVVVFNGFGEVRYLDVLYNSSNQSYSIQITDPDDPLIGHNYWIVKNSWGDTWGEAGFGKIIFPLNQFNNKKYIRTPIYSLVTTYSIECLDVDNDGYFNWGISEQKPSTCPTCHDDKDSNDGDPRIGPYDENYYGIPVKPEMIVKYETQVFSQVISSGGFFTFYETGSEVFFEFTINNPGNAQLNLTDPQFGISVTSSSSIDFEVTQQPSPSVPLNGDTTFIIKFTNTSQEKQMSVITINVLEPDMESFSFAMVETDCLYNSSDPEYITGTPPPWDQWDIKQRDVIIQSDAQLTITGHYGFVNEANIIIEQGGKLIIDGGHLTNACGSLWQGIDVWGNASESQYEQQYQGLIKLKNNGTIEYADVAIETIRYDYGEHNYTTSGGIVMINDGNLINNGIGVRFYPYVNRHPVTNEIMYNLSYFYKANFLSNNEIYKYVICPESNIHLDGVDGIKIEGCKFKNEAVDELHTFSGRGKGIFSFNSGFYIKEYDKYPDPEIIRTSFSHLDYGIYALTDRTTKLITIDSCLFKDNFRGTFLSGISNPKIICNEFHIRDNNSYFADDDKLVGLYLDEYTTGFQVEENQFYTTIPGNEIETKKCVGTVINNSGTEPNEIYNNTFNNILVGISAQGENRAETGEGLCLKCNDFIDCISDIFVTPEGGTTPEYLGIAIQQGIANGQPDGPARNTFTDNFPELEYNFDNITLNLINYAHHLDQGLFKLEPYPWNNINLQPDNIAPYSKEQSCPSNLGGGIDIPAEKNTITTETIQISVYEDTLSQVIDGGDTDGLNLEVQTSFPDEALQVRQELLNESPYLSDTVMETAIYKENVLPNVMIRDILVANPQSAKSAEVLNALDDRFDPMPDYMMVEIMQGQNTFGAKELLEQELARHITNRTKSFNKLILHYKQDTVNGWAQDSLLALLNTGHYPWPRYQAAFIYLENGDSVTMQNTLNNVTTEFLLTNREIFIHNLYSDLFDILTELQADSVAAIDSIQEAALLNIAQNNYLLPSVYARNILLKHGSITYVEPVYLPDNLKSIPAWQKAKTYKKTNQKLLKVFPNPAGHYFIIEYDLRKTEGKAVILLSDLNGRFVDSFIPNDKQNQQVIGTNTYSSGIYILQLFIDNELVETHKIEIAK